MNFRRIYWPLQTLKFYTYYHPTYTVNKRGLDTLNLSRFHSRRKRKLAVEGWQFQREKRLRKTSEKVIPSAIKRVVSEKTKHNEFTTKYGGTSQSKS